MEITAQENRSASRRTDGDRREGDRRSAGDRRQEVIEVPVERRIAGRRFVERREDMRRRVNERRHLLT